MRELDKNKAAAMLLVPMQLDALALQGQQGLWKDLTQNLDAVSVKNFGKNRALGQFIEPSPDAGSIKQAPLPNGIHLHWTIPEAFRRGEYQTGEEDGNLKFPLVPNRWLVVRFSRTGQRSWMVGSDLPPEGDAVPKAKDLNFLREQKLLGGGRIDPVSIGRWKDLHQWNEKGAGRMFLTALAPGNPSFAASYLHSRRMFGFRDDMAGAPDGLYSYFVAGWFSDPTRNPLNGIGAKKNLTKKLEQLGWIYDGEGLPDNILCHAFVNGVNWNSAQPVPLNAPRPGAFQVAIGQDGTEALAALLRSGTRDAVEKVTERMLAAYQYKLLRESGPEGEGAAALARKVHEGGFLSVDGGSHWEVTPPEKDDAETEAGRKPEGSSLRPFPVSVSLALERLNILQAEYNRLKTEQAATEDELYAVHYDWNFVQTDDWFNKTKPANREEASRALQRPLEEKEAALTGRLRAIGGAISGLINSDGPGLPEAREALKTALQKAGKPWDEFELKETPLPKFFEPSDPSVVIEGLRPDPRYYDAPSPTCRTEADLPDRFRLPSRLDLPIREALPAESKSCDAIAAATPHATIGLLLQEALLLSESSLPQFKTFIDIRSGGSDDSSLNAIRDAQKDPAKNAALFARAHGETALAPALKTRWEQPWVPLYLEWAVRWNSSCTPGTSPFTGWSFSPAKQEVDYTRPKGLALPGREQTFSGRVLLSSDPARKAAAFEDRLTAAGTPPGKPMRPMGQMLAGLTAQLARRRTAESLLPPLNARNEIDAIGKLVHHFHWRPETDEGIFSSVRAGGLELVVLRVVDGFGQAIDVLTPASKNLKLYPTAAYRNCMQAEAEDRRRFLLPPRFIQPSRIGLQWLNADDALPSAGNSAERPTDSDPATNPVCGWLLHHPLSGIVQVFNAKGDEIAELRGGKLVPVPGSNRIPLDGAGPELAGVVRFLTGNGKLVNDRLSTMAENLQTKASRDSLRPGIPMGMPVAILRAQVVLDRKGPDWRPADTAIRPDELLQPLPIGVGNSQSPIDGLLGCFAEHDYEHLRTPFGETDPLGPLLLPEKGKLRLTLLADPRAPVQLTCGFLPAARYELPKVAVEGPLKKLKVRFLTAPLLLPDKLLKMPLLQENGTKWEFITVAPEEKKLLTQTPEAAGPDSLKFPPLRLVEGWLRYLPGNDQ